MDTHIPEDREVMQDAANALADLRLQLERALATTATPLVLLRLALVRDADDNGEGDDE